MLTAEDVLTQKFREVWLRGYHQDDVDDFLDRVLRTMQAVQAGGPSPDPVTALDVRRMRFSQVRFRPGYDMTQVDDFVERAADTLQQLPTPPRDPAGFGPPAPPVAARTAPPVEQRSLTAGDVRRARLKRTKGEVGYDKEAVDVFLDLVIQTLDARAAGAERRHPVTSDDVAHARFEESKFRPAYDMQQVDELLTRVRFTLEDHPTGG